MKIGDKVEKVGGDYVFPGTVVSVFNKLSGKIRIVVEDDRGILHIFSEPNLKAKDKFIRYRRHDGKRELECEHGIGHGGVHGCDGCCNDPEFKKTWRKIFGRKK